MKISLPAENQPEMTCTHKNNKSMTHEIYTPQRSWGPVYTIRVDTIKVHKLIMKQNGKNNKPNIQ